MRKIQIKKLIEKINNLLIKQQKDINKTRKIKGFKN